MRRCASRKKSPESMTSAARLNASLCRRIAPSTDRSASRLCGRVRSATAVSGMARGSEKFLTFLSAGSFSHDADLEVRRDVAMELHRNGVVAELLDRLRELQLAAVQLEAFGGERLGDVAAGDRAVERLGLADLAGNLDLDAGHPLRHCLGDLLILELFHVELHALALDLLFVALGRQQRHLPRQEVVARVAVRDLQQVAAASEMVDVFSQYDFHGLSSTTYNAEL